jgi:hypothetical protein
MGPTIHELVPDPEHRLSVAIAQQLQGMREPAHG